MLTVPKTIMLTSLGLLFLLAATAAMASPPSAGGILQMQRISVDSNGAEADGISERPTISGEGRFIAFPSAAPNLVPGDTMGFIDIFVHDMQTGVTERVSVDSTGAEANLDSDNRLPAISADGRFVAFGSDASNLVQGDTNNVRDVFVHDLDTGITERVSVDSGGGEGDEPSERPFISADGRFVTFRSRATNLVPVDFNNRSDIFVHDRQTGVTERVSVDSNGVEGDQNSRAPSISADGRFVSFESRATNLVPGDTNVCPDFPLPGTCPDVFVHDRYTGSTTVRVSTASGGAQGSGESGGPPPISANGRFITFSSLADDLVAGDSNGKEDIFVHDRKTGVTERVSVDSSGSQGNLDTGGQSSISQDGRFVAFQSDASNLVPNDTNNVRDVFVHDRQTGETLRVSVDKNGIEGNGDSRQSWLSGNGCIVVFSSESSNLVQGDTNGARDIFVTINPLAGNPGACQARGTK